ncbi:MAG: hypothetical protein LBQ22_08475 [Bacteroidales bacterium]|nr:hypothetical protein [Bacteroidales bacterium]
MMKKLIYLLLPIFLFVACNNNQKAKETTEETQKCEQEEKKCCKDGEKKCCKELTEEQKAEMEAWNNWDSQTDEKKAELVENRKACIDKMMAEKAEKCEGKEGKEECPKKAEKCAELKAKMDNWDNLTIDEKKVLLDEFAPKCHKDGEGCKGHKDGEGCKGHKEGEGCKGHKE